MSDHQPPHIVHVGLGPVGSAIVREVLRRGAGQLVGAVDLDPAKAGQDLGAVIEAGESLGIEVGSDANTVLDNTVLCQNKPDLAILTTTSSLERLTPQVIDLVGRGIAVLSTCEELSYPWATRPDLAGEIDRAARAAGVAVLSNGVNPGFVMDFLPSALSTLCRDVRAVRVDRLLDAGVRRQAFQDKVGAGLDLAAFAERAAAGTLRHVGLRESADMVAAALGWQLDDYREDLEPVLADAPDRARGTLQVGRGFVAGEERVTLYFRAAVGEQDPHDRIVIDAEPPIDSTIRGGVHGDLATHNVVINAIPALLAAQPGLRTMLDLATPGCRAGRGRDA
nr:2,4-diaminopentanoate dehydrogenase-like [Nerophis lumbriciformis]